MSAGHFGDVRHKVLALHRSLVDIERRDYERAHGRLSPAEFLHHLLHDASLAWLKPLTGIIAQMDEAEEIEEPVRSEETQRALLLELRGLLRPSEGQGGSDRDFHQRYAALLQQEPDLVISHGKLIGSLPL